MCEEGWGGGGGGGGEERREGGGITLMANELFKNYII